MEGYTKVVKRADFFFFCFFFCLFFKSFWWGAHSWHMEVPRLGVKSELQLPAYTTATEIQDLRCICDLHHSSQQCQILNPQPHGSCQFHFCCTTTGTPKRADLNCKFPLVFLYSLSFIIYLFIYLFRTIPMAYGGSQARGRIRAAGAGLHHSHSNARSEPHLQPTLHLAARLDPLIH